MIFLEEYSPWSRVLLQKLNGFQLVEKFPAFYGTRRFIAALTSARHLSLPCASSIQSIHPHPTSWRSILIPSSYLHPGHLSFSFSHQNPVYASLKNMGELNINWGPEYGRTEYQLWGRNMGELNINWGVGIGQSVQRLYTDWTVRASNPGGGEIFLALPDRPCGPPILLYNGYRVLPGQSGRGVVLTIHPFYRRG
jgi:hypothetical protein